MAVQQEKAGSTIQLNPGAQHVMKDSDVCFYISVTKEENSACIFTPPNTQDDRQGSSKDQADSESNLPRRTVSAPSFSGWGHQWGRRGKELSGERKSAKTKVERNFEGNSLKLPQHEENPTLVCVTFCCY